MIKTFVIQPFYSIDYFANNLTTQDRIFVLMNEIYDEYFDHMTIRFNQGSFLVTYIKEIDNGVIDVLMTGYNNTAIGKKSFYLRER